MLLSIADLEAAGFTPEQIIRILKTQQEAQRKYERERKRAYRANVPGQPGTPGTNGTRSLSLRLPSKERIEEKKKERKIAPIDLNTWKPNDKHRELAASLGITDIDSWADRYRDQQANAKQRHRNPDAGFRTALRGRWFDKPNGGHTNGNGRQRPGLLEVIDNAVDRQAVADYVPGSQGPKPLALVSGESPHGIRGLPKG